MKGWVNLGVIQWFWTCNSWIKLGFTPCNAELPLQVMEFQEKEWEKDKRDIKNMFRKSPKKKVSVNSRFKGKKFLGKKFQCLAVQGKKLFTKIPYNIQDWWQKNHTTPGLVLRNCFVCGHHTPHLDVHQCGVQSPCSIVTTCYHMCTGLWSIFKMKTKED